MAHVIQFTFNPFQENTFIIYDDSKDCVIFDPGCLQDYEKETLTQYIEQEKLNPVRLINTHCHLDHIFGNKFVSEKYDLPLEIHKGELIVLQNAGIAASRWGIPYPEPSPMPEKYINEGDVIEFGNTRLKALFTPGHSPASLSFFCEADQFVIAGDVLFRQSIGRYDLPGGNLNTLLNSIRTQLFTLGDDVVVYAGHGPKTTIGYEKKYNPFLQE